MVSNEATPPDNAAPLAAREDEPAREPIAIIGIGCRFPGGAHDPESFWQLLVEGRDAISEVPADRWSIERFYSPDPGKPGTTTARWGGFVTQKMDEFDALFFGMSPREAAFLDPMQRWMLEVTWEALEDAGQVPERLSGSKTGVFIGCFAEDSKLLQLSRTNRDLIGPHTSAGCSMTMMANRLSYLFDFRGPSMAVDTACSSALVALHLACQSIWNGESTLAVSGGATAMFFPEITISESKASMLSPDGRSKAFDSRANGYVRGEGAAVVVLKPLSQALADGDPIYALVRATGTNQDGHTNGITVPNGLAQQALMREVYERAGVVPGQVQYVEAHGTGTPVGDPIEANALATVLAIGRPEGEKCVIGSVKTNIGHLEAAAGIAGLIKVALALKHGAIPPHLHFLQANPKIDFDRLCVRVPRELEPWPATDGPRLAGLNSFGFGGANAHALLEGPPVIAEQPAAEAEPETTHLLPLSARSPEALEAQVRSLHALVAANRERPASWLRDLGYSASLRRSHHDHRLALRADSIAALEEQLRGRIEGEPVAGMSSGRRGAEPQRLAFVFGGMGPQWWAMGRQLLAQEPVFYEAVRACDELFTQHAGWSLLAELLADEERSRIGETQVAQPAIFALQVGLAALWRSWGIVPAAIVGHSAGEVAAAYCAGVYSLEDAVRVIYHRSRLQHTTAGQGRLVAVGVAYEELKDSLAGYENRISVAAVNSPGAVTLVGDQEALDAFVAPLQERGVFVRFLRGDVPYHSHYMNPIRAELLETLAPIRPQPAQTPLFSTVSGERSPGTEWDAGYWWNNVRNPVLFAAATDALIAEGYDAFLELAPHPVLAASIQECLALRGVKGTVWASLRRQAPERATMLETLGSLYTCGAPVRWEALYGAGGRWTPLPAYPWQRERYWAETEQSLLDRLGTAEHILLGERVETAQPTWKTRIDLNHTPYLADHCIQGAAIYPGAGYVEMMLAATKELFADAGGPVELIDVVFHKALFLPQGAYPEVHVAFDPAHAAFSIAHLADGAERSWVQHATAELRVLPAGETPGRAALERLRAEHTRALAAEQYYGYLRGMGLEYGPQFQGIKQLLLGPASALARLELDEAALTAGTDYSCHPALLDTCFHMMLAAMLRAELPAESPQQPYVLARLGRLRVYRPLPATIWAHAVILEHNDRQVRGSLEAYDEAGNVVLEAEDVVAYALESQPQAATPRELGKLFYTPEWVELADAPEAAPAAERASGSWLILADEEGFGAALAERLEAQGDRVSLAFPGPRYQELRPGQEFVLDPARPEDFHQLAATLQDQTNAPWRGVVHLWGLAAPSEEQLTPEALDRAQTLGPIALLHLVQALDRGALRNPPRIWAVTRGVHAIAGAAPPMAPAQAAIWGFMRVLGYQEHPELFGAVVDLDPAVSPGELEMLLQDLRRDGGDQLVYRGAQRFGPRLAAAPALPSALPVPVFQANGSYLITGGLGGLGLKVARWMAEHGAGHLILLGRNGLPPRSAWRTVQPDTPLAERVQAVRQLEALGAHVHVAAVDVADQDQLAAFFAGYQEECWPPIKGVVHAAGVTRSHLMVQMTKEDYVEIARSKVLGAWLLHQQLRETPLDFFVLFSSVASFGVTTGQSDYAAANTFLDALAGYRRAQGLPAVSVNWGAWAEAGMAVALEEYFRRRGVGMLALEQGLAALAQLLLKNPAQASVFAVDWPTLGQQNFPAGVVPPMIAHLLAAAGHGDAAAGADESAGVVQIIFQHDDPAERLAYLAGHLQGLAGRVLRLAASKLDPLQPLSGYGLDSLMAVELKNHIEADLHVTVSVMDLLQGTSIAGLAERVLGRLQPPEAAPVDELLEALEGLDPEELRQLLETTLLQPA